MGQTGRMGPMLRVRFGVAPDFHVMSGVWGRCLIDLRISTIRGDFLKWGFMSNKPLVIAGREFGSRLILGTGKFSSPEAMRDALAASGTGMVTVALRRADLSGRKDPFANILEFIDPAKYLLLPNTSGAMN